MPLRTKSAAWLPPSVRPVTFRTPLPTFVIVIVCSALCVPISCGPNVSELALTEIVGAGAGVPVPFSATLLDPLVALCVKTSEAVAAPSTVGR